MLRGVLVSARPIHHRAIPWLCLAAAFTSSPRVLAAPDAPEAAAEPEPPAPAEPPPPRVNPETIDALKEQLDALQRKVDAMEQEQREAQNAEAADVEPEASEPEASTPPAPPQAEAAPPEPVVTSSDGDASHNRPPNYADGFHFGSYGRVAVGTDHRGRPGRDGDIVARGSRLDESTYLELELRREDYWEQTGAHTRIVTTLALAPPLFHGTGSFNTNIGIRNLYIEESGLGSKRLRVWAGSRMYRGDDIYLLDFWPLDNLNTVGGGASYRFLESLTLKLHTGINQPQHPFFFQTSPRPLPLEQLGETQVPINDRQKFISSARVSNIFPMGNGGIKPVLYGEVHYTPAAQRERDVRQFEGLPLDTGFLIGTQLGLFTGKRSTHLNLVFRYAGGLAAYGEFNAPTQLGPDRTSKGAREIVAALSGNYEKGPFGLLVGSYWRLFRNASESLDYADLGEGIVIARPTVWIGKGGGVSLEGSYQAQRRGVLIDQDANAKPQFGQMGRIGLVPFLSPGGRGNYQRPHLRLMYLMTMRDEGARRLYARDDVRGIRSVDHYIGLGAEWWFGSTSYFRD